MALTTKKIDQLKQTPGRYLDGGDWGRGLYLQVTEGGASWLLRYQRSGHERWMGLGSLKDFSLKEARARAREKRQLIADGVDPLELKKTAKAIEAAKVKTINFEEAARQYFNCMKGMAQSETSRTIPVVANHLCVSNYRENAAGRY